MKTLEQELEEIERLKHRFQDIEELHEVNSDPLLKETLYEQFLQNQQTQQEKDRLTVKHPVIYQTLINLAEMRFNYSISKKISLLFGSTTSAFYYFGHPYLAMINSLLLVGPLLKTFFMFGGQSNMVTEIELLPCMEKVKIGHGIYGGSFQSFIKDIEIIRTVDGVRT